MLRLSNAARSRAVHDVAASGFATNNDFYHAARPSYPKSALEYIAANVDPTRIIEAGSGTGIFSRLLLAPPEGYPHFSIDKLVAVEPSAGMRATWSKSVKSSVGHTVSGAFDDFSNVEMRSRASCVIIAQAWHWCPNHDAALKEIGKYLSSGGKLVLIWNLESDGDDFHKGLREIYQPFDLSSPQYYRGLWKDMFKCEAYDALFEPATEAHFDWDVGITEDALVDRLFSKSYLSKAHLSGDRRVEFEEKLRKFVREADKEWIDEEKGIFKYKYVTDVYIMRRK